MKSKFMIATLTLVSKLMDIPKHLRDCNADIVEFAKLFAEQLAGSGPPKKAVLLPWDFVNEWNEVIEEVRSKLGITPLDFDLFTPGPLSHWDREKLVNFNTKMMPWFAEDLCGKEFAEVAEMCQEDGIGKLKPQPNEPASGDCHPFPPGDPVLVEEGKRAIKNNTGLSEVEHTPAPSDAEFGNHMEAE